MAEHTTPAAGRARPAVIIETSPTPNGNLHIGHLAGPFMGADVHARYLRTRGRPVVFSTGTDDSQTYVMASARRHGTTPERLAAVSHEEIGRTLRLAGISVDGYAPYDEKYKANVLRFLTDLHDADKLELRTVSFPYNERTGEFLVEGLVAGYCPVCVTESRGGVCEMCGHPNNFDELLSPWSTLNPEDPVVLREATVLVLPMERYRKELTDYYETHGDGLRPRTLAFLREALARPLPDFPVTYPISYGLPSPFPGTEGQRVNSWVEGIPAAMFCTAHAAAELGPERVGTDLWLPEREAEIIYFIGSDIVYFWGLTHMALLLAHDGRYALPERIISNEFYELENEKVSTTRGHVVYMDELLADFSRDAIRFHLTLTGPEHQRTNFSRDALTKVTERSLTAPWNRLANVLNALAATAGAELPVSAGGRLRARAVAERFVDAYEIAAYRPSSAADLVVSQLQRLGKDAARAADRPAADRAEALGDLFLELRAVLAGAAPILIDTAEQARQTGGWDGTLEPSAFEVASVRPFRVPPFGGAGGPQG
ncbi:class I tRNA ligase family protein [Streptomyces gilvosporeus]|uniref:Methionine--tRNA ligase n=1 Tax=Streptomyces gilvosporeus TaxID=553510 RepID=A0A1V0TN04_9ACTN|nr:class I tRNA ligase family protein [Streptomyces gilvosporeus]ARF54335.1 methionine--tRNA ligase [Streptomyces gilvosporeus]